MTKRLVVLAQFLTYHEAVELYQDLKAMQVIALVKSCGPPTFPFGEGKYFQLLVQAEDLAVAQPVFDLFFEKQAENRKQTPTCPACGSVYVAAVTQKTIWQKIKYAGNQLIACQNCPKIFFH